MLAGMQVKATESPGTMRMSMGTSLAASQRSAAANPASAKSTMDKSVKSVAAVTRPMGATLPVRV